MFIGIFVIEALIKMAAHYPRIERYFRDGWNVFDFAIIVVSLLPSTGELATLARLARLLRVLRLVSALPELRLIVTTLIRSIPGMFNVIAPVHHLLCLCGAGLSPLPRGGSHPLAQPWHCPLVAVPHRHAGGLDRHHVRRDGGALVGMAYFVSFVVMGTFVVVNLFIAVVLNNLDEAKQERLAELRSEPSHKEIVAELERTRTTLARLEQRLGGGGEGTDQQPDARA